MQVFLTKLKNRGMEIETLTSGPGIVFTYKDFNECMNHFCAEIVTLSEKELRSRTQDSHNIIAYLKHQLYIKDTRLEGYRRKLSLVSENLNRIVNARIYEKGSALIYELDQSTRQLKFY